MSLRAIDELLDRLRELTGREGLDVTATPRGPRSYVYALHDPDEDHIGMSHCYSMSEMCFYLNGLIDGINWGRANPKGDPQE